MVANTFQTKKAMKPKKLPKAIQDAIDAGNTKVAEQRKLEEEKALIQIAKTKIYEEKERKLAKKWAKEILLKLIEAQTAKNNRHLSLDGSENVSSKFKAEICKKLGFKVDESWVEPWSDEGAYFGGYMSYSIDW